MRALLNQTFDRKLAIAKIEHRNQVRREAKLPPVDIDKEILILEKVVIEKDYENFLLENEGMRRRFAEKNLRRMRKWYGDPEWKPRGVIANWGFYSHVNDRMRRVYKSRIKRISAAVDT